MSQKCYVKLLKENPNLNPRPIVESLQNRIKELEKKNEKLEKIISDMNEPIEIKEVDCETVKIEDCTHQLKTVIQGWHTSWYRLPCVILEEQTIRQFKLFVIGNRYKSGDQHSGEVKIVKDLTRVTKLTENDKKFFIDRAGDDNLRDVSLSTTKQVNKKSKQFRIGG